MYPISLPTAGFILALLAYATSLVLYRRALVRHGHRQPFFAEGRTDSIFDPLLQEGLNWAHDLFSHQAMRDLEIYRLISLLLMVAMVATMAWVVILG